MSQTPTSVFDPFDITQFPGVPIQDPTNTWRPIDSFRQIAPPPGTTTDVVSSNINFGAPSRWLLLSPGGNPSKTAQSELIYTPPGGSITSYDLSNISTISLNNIEYSSTFVAPLVTFTLELTQFGGATASSSQSFNTPYPTTVTFDLSDPVFAGLDLTNIIQILFRISYPYTGIQFAVSVDSITSVLICVARDTMIMLPNGTQKAIQDLKRGDLVAGNSHTKPAYRVARIIHTKLSAMSPVGLVKISKNALGVNQPNADIIISGNHPVLYNGSRYRAKSLRSIDGVHYYGKDKTVAKDVLPKNDDGTYSLYNIQFEHDGYFVANNLIVDSVPSHSKVAPLSKEFFFNKRFQQKSIKIIKPKLMKRLAMATL